MKKTAVFKQKSLKHGPKPKTSVTKAPVLSKIRQILGKKDLSNVFGNPLWERDVCVPKQFSLDKNVAPCTEYDYGIMGDCIRDNFFEPLSWSGSGHLSVVPMLKNVDDFQLAQAANKQDAIATIAVLHHLMKTSNHSLDLLNPRIIVVPCLSKLPNQYGYRFCPYLPWNAEYQTRFWNDYSVGDKWNKVAYVALLTPIK